MWYIVELFVVVGWDVDGILVVVVDEMLVVLLVGGIEFVDFVDLDVVLVVLDVIGFVVSLEL